MISCSIRYTSIVQKLSNKQSAKVICRFDSITQQVIEKPHEHWKGYRPAHAFNYIMLRVDPGLTSCGDIATALHISQTCHKADSSYTWVSAKKFLWLAQLTSKSKHANSWTFTLKILYMYPYIGPSSSIVHSKTWNGAMSSYTFPALISQWQW